MVHRMVRILDLDSAAGDRARVARNHCADGSFWALASRLAAWRQKRRVRANDSRRAPATRMVDDVLATEPPAQLGHVASSSTGCAILSKRTDRVLPLCSRCDRHRRASRSIAWKCSRFLPACPRGSNRLTNCCRSHWGLPLVETTITRRPGHSPAYDRPNRLLIRLEQTEHHQSSDARGPRSASARSSRPSRLQARDRRTGSDATERA